jgi:hypothetical protein
LINEKVARDEFHDALVSKVDNHVYWQLVPPGKSPAE